MDCRTFRDQHTCFLDNALPGAMRRKMQRHLAECAACARHDTTVRRALLLVRNLPSIEPSPDFGARLNARLREVRAAATRSSALRRPPGRAAFAAAAASVVAVGYLAAATFDWTRVPELRLAPVVVAQADPVPSPIASPEIIASVSTGLAMWPAALLAERGPEHYASAEFKLASWER